MIRSLPSRIALLAFSVAVIAGLRAANSAATVLWRAMAAMFAAYVVGEMAMRAARLVTREHLGRRKWDADRRHVEALARAAADADASPDAPEVG